jgi:hypothetical protein
MSGRLFSATTTEFCRFSGTPPVTASPFTLLLAAQSATIGGGVGRVGIGLFSSTTTDNYRIAMQSSTGAGNFTASQGGVVGTCNTTNIPVADTPFITIGREFAANSRDVTVDGLIANKGTSASSKLPAGLDRLSIGKEDGTGNKDPWNGVIFYAALWSAALSDEEVSALGRGAPPPLIRPSALKCYWPILGRSDGTTIIDVTGRCPLTITGGSDSSIGMARILTRGPLVGMRTTFVGTGVGTVAALTGAGAGAHGVAGVAAATLNPLSGAASGTHVPFIGAAAASLNRLAGIASATHTPFIGTAAGTLNPLTGSAVGTHGAFVVFGSGAGALNPLTGTAVGTHTPAAIVGVAAGTLNQLLGTAAGTHHPVVSGVGAGVLARLQGFAVGVAGFTVVGVGDGELGRLVGEASGWFQLPYIPAECPLTGFRLTERNAVYDSERRIFIDRDAFDEPASSPRPARSPPPVLRLR